MTSNRLPKAARRAFVLLVDSHPDTLNLYADYLRFKGMTVLATRSPRNAMEWARRQQPDAICVSYQLEGLDGADLTARLKSGAHTRVIPVLLLTSFVSPTDLRRAEESGADAVLLKPLLPEALFDELARVIATPQE